MSRVRTAVEELTHVMEPFAPTPPPDEQVELAERRKVVREALGRLSAKDREAVSLYYVDGLSYADIAGFLGVSETTVQGRLQRGRARMRKELAMVEETFRNEELPDDFSAEIQRLLESAATRGLAHERAIKRLAEIGRPAVDALCKALSDSRAPVRRAAGAALCSIGDPRALQPIVHVLYSKDWPLEDLFRSGRALDLPGVRAEMLKIVRERRTEALYWAIQALATAKGDEEVFETLHGLLNDRSARPGDRAQAAWAMCEIRPDSAQEILTDALRDPDVARKTHVPWLAARYGTRPPIDACLNAFEHVIPHCAAAAAQLVMQHGEEGLSALENVLHTGSRRERLTAALALVGRQHPEAFEVLKAALLRGTGDSNLARQVTRVVGRFYGREVAEWVKAEGASLARADGVLMALLRSPQPDAEEAVEKLFHDGTPSVRAAAMRILARRRGADFLPELRACLRDGRPRKVAQAAYWVIVALRDAAEPAAREMLESEHWPERKAALCLFRRWGKITPEMAERARRDEHVAVRHAAYALTGRLAYRVLQ